MPSLLFQKIDLDQIYLPFAEKLFTLIDRCKARGAYYYAVSGYRPSDEQDKKYAQGRTAPGPIITNAPGGFSWHNYGLAVDFCRDEDLARVGLQTHWDNEGYDILKEEGKKLGLKVGVPAVPGGDPGHVQHRNPLTLVQCRVLGVKAVWARLDEIAPV